MYYILNILYITDSVTDLNLGLVYDLGPVIIYHAYKGFVLNYHQVIYLFYFI